MFKKIIVLFVSALVLALPASAASYTASKPVNVSKEENNTIAQEIVSLVNKERMNAGLAPIALDDEKELAIGEMFKENSSQNNANNDNIVLDNELSQELDQYLNNLDLPNS